MHHPTSSSDPLAKPDKPSCLDALENKFNKIKGERLQTLDLYVRRSEHSRTFRNSRLHPRTTSLLVYASTFVIQRIVGQGETHAKNQETDSCRRNGSAGHCSVRCVIGNVRFVASRLLVQVRHRPRHMSISASSSQADSVLIRPLQHRLNSLITKAFPPPIDNAAAAEKRNAPKGVSSHSQPLETHILKN